MNLVVILGKQLQIIHEVQVISFGILYSIPASRKTMDNGIMTIRKISDETSRLGIFPLLTLNSDVYFPRTNWFFTEVCYIDYLIPKYFWFTDHLILKHFWLPHSQIFLISWLPHSQIFLTLWLPHSQIFLIPWLPHSQTFLIPWLPPSQIFPIPWLPHSQLQLEL